MKYCLSFILTLFLLIAVVAQDYEISTNAEFNVNPDVASKDLEGHYLGLQANELVRQLINFGDATLPSNPYFLNYKYVSETGGAFNLGFALTANSISNNTDFNSSISDIDRFFLRLGYEKIKWLNDRFNYSLGLDFLIDYDKTETETEDNFNEFIITTSTSTTGWGIGPRFTLNYQISNRLFIGTEANYYFKRTTSEFKVENENFPEGDIDDKNEVSQFLFNLPAVLWVTIRL